MKRVTAVAAASAAVVLLLTAAPAALAHPVVTDPQDCIDCHTILTPGIVTQYQNGAMGDGVDGGATCIDCHSTDPTGGLVPAGRCAVCHPDQYAEFTVKDGAGAYINKHAVGWAKMTAGARYMVMPAEERYEMCERCHNVGYVYGDGSVGKCDSCHTRHVFSVEEARDPEACGTCHMGPDHEQIDMWEKSKHGVVYTTEKKRPGGDPTRAPSCITCHMPTMVNDAGNPLTHNVSTNLTLGTVAQGARLTGTALSVPMRTISQTDFDTRRGDMEMVCTQCHAPSFVEKNLEGADEIKRDVDELLWDPVMRIRGLWYDGLLDPMPPNRPPNPAYPTVDGGYVLVLGGQQLYTNTSQIEQYFFYTYKYDHVNTFKGAYHINPDYSHWFGWSEVNQDIDIIKGEEAALRSRGDPGFTIGSRADVGQDVTFDAGALAAWGDPSFNTWGWSFGDTSTIAPGPDKAQVTHRFAAPGTYQVRLTVSDSDLVNNAATPTLCSAKRTTEVDVTVMYGATLNMTSIKRVRRGRQCTVKTTFTTGDAVAGGTLELWAKPRGGSWKLLTTRIVATTAGVPLTVTFRPVLRKKTGYKVMWDGDGDTWDARSNVRTVTPL